MIKKALGIFVLIFMSTSLSYAHGPISTVNGNPVIWRHLPLSYQVDLGTLGVYTNEQATELTDSSFSAWTDVSTSNFAAVNTGHLPVDVTVVNYWNYLSTYGDGINPVVFDTDGRILDQIFGGGASSVILGYSQPAYNPLENSFVEAEVVINGVPTSYHTRLEIMSTIVHELGHMAGLDHTQINGDFAFTGYTNDTIYIPTMYPTSTQNDEPLAELNPDDIAGVTILYPNERSMAEFGIIKGKVTRLNGDPVLGANVLARMVDNELMNVFSSVSDYMMQNNGEWEMWVYPGTYKLSIEPVDSNFTQGSSVGPYADDSNDLSFQNQVSQQQCSQTFTVAAGETLDGITIVEGGECFVDDQGDGSTPTNPRVTIATDRVSYIEGQTLVVNLRLSAGTENNLVDWYWLVLAPDGAIYNMSNYLIESENFSPYRSNYTVNNHEEQISFLLSDIPSGLYTFGVLLTTPGADLMDSASWLRDPSITEFIFINRSGN